MREEGQDAAGGYPSAFSLTDAEAKVQTQPKSCKKESTGVWQPCKAGGQQHPAAGLFGERGQPDLQGTARFCTPKHPWPHSHRLHTGRQPPLRNTTALLET